MRRGSSLAVLLVALLVGAAAPDAGQPKAPKAEPAAADAGARAPSEDEEIIKELELLENLDVLERLEQVDVGD